VESGKDVRIKDKGPREKGKGKGLRPEGEDADAFDTGSGEDFGGVRRFGEGTGEIKTREVKLLMLASAPLGTVGYIVDDALKGDVNRLAALAVVALELTFGKNPFSCHYSLNTFYRRVRRVR